jgi:osmotically-inducible protein OsmY
MMTAEHPKHARHSPADIAAKSFRDSSYQAIRGLSCSFRDGVLTIEGHLPNFHLNQVALTAVQDIEGVERIENKVEVAR